MRGRRRVFEVVAGRARVVFATARSGRALGPATAAALLLVGCGGAKQDAHEKSADYSMELVHASFPSAQSVARPANLEVQVRNSGSVAVPNVAVTVDSFTYASKFPELAAAQRPVWAIEQGPGAVARPPVESQEVSTPGSGQTAYVNTWALGPLAAGGTQTFTWHVVPVKPGSYTVHFLVSAGLSGRARARLAAGGPVSGHFTVSIGGVPPKTVVDPSTGRVVAGTAPPLP